MASNIEFQKYSWKKDVKNENEELNMQNDEGTYSKKKAVHYYRLISCETTSQKVSKQYPPIQIFMNRMEK